ncbi:Cyclic di-GMP phosphodiesterase response regulator RpfG [Natranaerofaba carboxydovora]|nr:Cyclic di-GMP phosphodiesterase response regulator RpfG [Natranaerofaba carboxydovora]
MEVLALYDISSLSFSVDDKELKQEIIEKGSRVLGAKKIAIFITDDEGELSPYCIWGFGSRKEDELTFIQLKEMFLEKGNNTFEYNFDTGTIFFEHCHEMNSNREKLFNIFSKRLEDILKRKQYWSYLIYNSNHDALTGLYNRAYFEKCLEHLKESEKDYPVTIISVDLDGLKVINDSMGHDVGDQLIKSAADILEEKAGDMNILARVGGDEFSIIMPRTPEELGENIVNDICKKVDEHNTDNPKFPLNISIGVSTAHNSDKLMDATKEAADSMYRSKLHKEAGTRSQILNTLMAALRERDHITEGHANRLGDLCEKVGKEIGLSHRQLNDLSLLAQVHDLGKVGIPDHILFKEGPLDDEEWKIIKTHSEKGYRIALSSLDMAGVAGLILKHHERWDGKGYPLGLKGEEIPIECRIIAVADAYDAMISDRPYRDAMEKEKAISEIKASSGTQFDPLVVNAFVFVLKKEIAL